MIPPADTPRPRLLRLRTFNDLAAELDRLVASAEAGTLREVGQWQIGNTLQGLAETIRSALDGAPERSLVKVDAVLTRKERRLVALGRLIARLFRPLFKRSTIQWGEPSDLRTLEHLAQMRTHNPVPRVPFDIGAAELSAQLKRVLAGERMTQRSPVLGKMSHEQWTALVLTNANMQLGMVVV